MTSVTEETVTQKEEEVKWEEDVYPDLDDDYEAERAAIDREMARKEVSNELWQTLCSITSTI